MLKEMLENDMVKELDQYGLPPKFKSWAKYQRKTVQKIVDSDKKYFVLRAPTGSGKSVMGIVAGLELGVKTYYVVHNKQLQRQITKDFPFVKEVKGRANFTCLASIIGESCDPGFNCASGRRCSFSDNCGYKVQKRIAQESNFVVFNYAYFLAIMNSKHGGFERPGLIILDEAHIADSALSGFVNFDISRRQLDMNRLRFPNHGEYVYEWLEYLKAETGAKIDAHYNMVANKKCDTDTMNAINKDLKRLKTINYKASFLSNNIDDKNWIIEMYSDRYSDHIRFVPVWVNKFSKMLLGHANKYLLMSATISKFDMELLGIDKNDMEFLDMPSTFNPSNMPVKYIPFEKINRSTDKNKIVIMIDGIIKRHLEEKGVLHTVSYQLSRYILEHSSYASRMISNSNSDIYTDAHILDNRDDAIEEFLESDKPKILVSPSVETGLDLKDDLGRWQIVCKVPFASLGDKVVARRKSDNPLWYTNDAINRIVQAAGRVCRSSTDHGITYIIDKNLSWIVKRHQKSFPRWWLKSLKAGNKLGGKV